jgi:hypothetical protein
MRIQVYIRDDLARVLADLAWQENRWPKQQAEWLLWRALEQAAQESQLQPQEVASANAE